MHNIEELPFSYPLVAELATSVSTKLRNVKQPCQ